MSTCMERDTVLGASSVTLPRLAPVAKTYWTGRVGPPSCWLGRSARRWRRDDGTLAERKRPGRGGHGQRLGSADDEAGDRGASRVRGGLRGAGSLGPPAAVRHAGLRQRRRGAGATGDRSRG